MSAGIARLKRLLGDRGAAAAIDSLSADLRALQQQVAGLQRHVHELEASQEVMGSRQVEEFDRIRASISEVADDLSERIAAVQRRSAAEGAPG